MAARIEIIAEPAEVSTQAEALGLQLRERAVEILSLLPGVPAELAHALQATRAPSQLADIVASLIDAEVGEKQVLLETLNTEERLQKVLAILSRRIEVLRLSQEIGERTKEQLGPQQVLGACLCCCNGRGKNLFGRPNHDAELVQRRLGPFGLSGFFCNGEIGPVGERNFLHGYTASLALFVRK